MTSLDTRNANYHEHRESGALGKQQRVVMDEIKARGAGTRSELAKRTGITINAIAGRVNELVAAGLLVEYPQRKCACTGRTVTPVGVPVPVQASIQFEGTATNSNRPLALPDSVCAARLAGLPIGA